MDKPHKRFRVTLKIEAWKWEDVVRELEWLRFHLESHGSECNSVMGGGSRSHTVQVEEDPDMTEEQWERDLDAYIECLKKAKP